MQDEDSKHEEIHAYLLLLVLSDVRCRTKLPDCYPNASSPARRSRRPGRQRRQFRGVAGRRRSAELARRYNLEGIDELVILDITATLERPARAGRHDQPRRAGAVHSAGRRRRHPFRRRRAAAVGRGRGQDQPEHGGALEPGADCHAGSPLRQPGVSSSPSTRNACPGRHRRRMATPSPSTREVARPRPARDAVEWAREAEDRGAAKSC